MCMLLLLGGALGAVLSLLHAAEERRCAATRLSPLCCSYLCHSLSCSPSFVSLPSLPGSCSRGVCPGRTRLRAGWCSASCSKSE